MKKITKSLMTLALLLVGLTSANAEKREKVAEIDWTTQFPYNYYAMGTPGEGCSFDVGQYEYTVYGDNQRAVDETKEVVKYGCLRIINVAEGKANWEFQPFIIDKLTLSAGATYAVDITYKSTKSGTADGSMGIWGSAKSANFNLEETTEWKVAEGIYKDFPIAGDKNIHICFQMGSIVGTIDIAKVEIFLVTPDAPEASISYGDMKEVTPVIYGKEDGAAAASVLEAVDGIYSVSNTLTEGDDHKTQFWIAAPYAIPVGQQFYVEFEYKADVAAKCATQTHGATPGSYIIYHCIGDVEFAAPTEAAGEEPATDGWKKFTKTVTIENDMNGWQSIAFNLNKHETNTYYFRNIKLQLPEVSEAVSLSVSAAGWSSFSSDKNVQLAGCTGWAAKYVDGKIVLTKVTEVPAENGILIEAAAGVTKYTFPIISSATSITGNELQVSDGTVTGASGKIYVLANGSYGVGFYKLASDATLPKGKVYLEVNDAPTVVESREFIAIAGEATGIKTVENQKKSGIIYNLAGQQVKNAKKGLYIIDGKKIAVK